MKIAVFIKDIRTWDSRDILIYGFVLFSGVKMRCAIKLSGLEMRETGWNKCIMLYTKDFKWEVVRLCGFGSPWCFS